MRRLVLLSALLFACGGAPAQESTAAPATPTELPIPEDLRAVVTRSINIGSDLYVLDMASAIATDVLFALAGELKRRG